MTQQRILVVGAGLMGSGIAQVAALSGHPVFLFDQRAGAAKQLRDGRQASVAIEAVVEDLEVKRGLMRELEELLDSGAVLATNMSSFSITAIAAGLKFPERVVGMHFFNPVPLMALVEVVSRLRTSPKVVEAIETLAREWGKVAVRAQSSPDRVSSWLQRVGQS
jgi:3-hydroxybutyryl-CoA dehydrogenase